MLDIPALRAVCDAATPGPWEITRDKNMEEAWCWWIDVGPLCEAFRDEITDSDYNDVNFVSTARAALPAALDEIERLREALRKIAEGRFHEHHCNCFEYCECAEHIAQTTLEAKP